MRTQKLQVFLSSTYEDLVNERLAAMEAILSAGHIPAAMEQFSPGDETALERIQAWIEESDAFVLILGGRYGSIEPASGKSYVQLEYEFALKQKKPFFALVVTKQHHERRVKEFGLSVDEREQEQRYKEFKAIVTGKLCAFWNDTKDIRAAILQKLPEWTRRQDLKGWVRGDEIAGPEVLLDFEQVTVSVGTIDEWYRRTKEEVWICGNDCKTAMEAKSRTVKAMLDRNIRVRVLCVNPDSPAANMLPMIDPRFPTVELLRSSLQSVRHVMEHFKAQYPSLFEYRYLPILPAFGLFITEPQRPNGLMKVELYASQPWDPVGSRPNIIIPAKETRWRSFFLQQWANYWRLADPNHQSISSTGSR
jgi:hypothetical protein